MTACIVTGIICLVFGAFIGMVVTSCVVVGKKADEEAEKDWQARKEAETQKAKEIIDAQEGTLVTPEEYRISIQKKETHTTMSPLQAKFETEMETEKRIAKMSPEKRKALEKTIEEIHREYPLDSISRTIKITEAVLEAERISDSDEPYDES